MVGLGSKELRKASSIISIVGTDFTLLFLPSSLMPCSLCQPVDYPVSGVTVSKLIPIRTGFERQKFPRYQVPSRAGVDLSAYNSQIGLWEAAEFGVYTANVSAAGFGAQALTNHRLLALRYSHQPTVFGKAFATVNSAIPALVAADQSRVLF